MKSLLAKLVIAVVIGVIVTLACLLLGAILIGLNVALAIVVGGFLESYAGVLGVLAALWSFFTGKPTIKNLG